jgi:hypothetical protein
MNPLWINGVGDRTLSKVIYWMNNYDKGKVCATRQYMTKPGQTGAEVKVINMPTAKAVKVPWQLDELNYLASVLEQARPNWPVTSGFKKDVPRWRNGQLVPTGTGQRLLEMAIYPQELLEIYATLLEVKNGKKAEGSQSIDDVDFESILNKGS